MSLNCTVCNRPDLAPEGLQTWNDVLVEHFLICSINVTDGFRARERPIDLVNKLGVHFEVISSSDLVVLFSVSRVALDRLAPYYAADSGENFFFKANRIDQLIDFFREEHSIPIPSIRN